jgi:uncharacterized protein
MKIFLGIFGVTLIFGVMFYLVFQSRKPEFKQIPQLQIELADTPDKQQKGLMNRDSLCETCAMVFVFENEEIQSFWMKNTRIPLDIIFIDKAGHIVTVYEKTTAFQTDPTYSSTKPAKYVLETNSGFAKKNNLQVGDRIDLKNLIGSQY